MSPSKIIRAWKDPAYRQSLSAAEQAEIPENPAGAVELTAEEMKAVNGGTVTTNTFFTTCCACGIAAPGARRKRYTLAIPTATAIVRR